MSSEEEPNYRTLMESKIASDDFGIAVDLPIWERMWEMTDSPFIERESPSDLANVTGDPVNLLLSL
jgi:hypothetical protein